MNIRKQKKGFTLVELIVVMAILAVLVLLAAPRFIGQTKEAQLTKHITNVKVMEDASERYYIDHGKWPRGLDTDVYTPEEVSAYADKIYDITGEETTLEDGNYWDIDYAALDAYAKLPDESERANYVLRNPVGKIYYLEGLSPVGENRTDQAYLSDNTPVAVISATAEEGSLQHGFYVGEAINWSHEGSHSPSGSAIVAAEWKEKQDKYEKTGTPRIGLRVQNELGFWSEWAYQEIEIMNPSIRFSGLSAAAYDGDAKTAHSGVGTVTWTGDLSNREIHIKVNSGRFETLYLTFQDKNGTTVETAGGLSTIMISQYTALTHSVVVPVGATQMKFSGAGTVYEIIAPSVMARPDAPDVSVSSTDSAITLEWATTRRVHIYKNGSLLVDVTGSKYIDNPLYADSEHTYNFLFLDEYGNGMVGKELTAQTQSKDIVFRGLSPAAFDGNTKTAHSGVGTVTWTGDLSNREIKITGYAAKYASLSVTFKNSSGEVVNTITGQSKTSVVDGGTFGGTGTGAIVVPEGATIMEFSGANSVRIYEIAS